MRLSQYQSHGPILLPRNSLLLILLLIAALTIFSFHLIIKGTKQRFYFLPELNLKFTFLKKQVAGNQANLTHFHMDWHSLFISHVMTNLFLFLIPKLAHPHY